MHSALKVVRCSLPLLLASLILNLNAALPVIPDAVQANIRQRVDYGYTSGLPSTPSNLISTDGSNPFADYSPGAMLEFLNSFTLTRAPGARYEYSNYGAGLLGYLLAANRGWIPSPLQSAMLSAHQPYTTNTLLEIITLEDSPHLPRCFFRTLKLTGE